MAINNSLKEQYNILDALEAAIYVSNAELQHPATTNFTKITISTNAHGSDYTEEKENLFSLEDEKLDNWFQVEIIDSELVYMHVTLVVRVLMMTTRLQNI